MDMHPNVKYELSELERLLSPDRQKSTKERLSESDLKEKIQSEVERIKQTLVYEVFSFEDERHLERYIQYHQQALIRLIDKASLLINGNWSSHQRNFYLEFYQAFDELLSFIERHFTKYFDQDAKAPESYVALARKDAKVNIKKLEKVFAGKKAEEKLIELLFRVIRKVIDSKSEMTITYRHVMYAKEVQKELFRMFEKLAPESDINEELRQIMYYLNYNSTKVLTYHAHYVSALLDALETRSEKIEKLSFVLKRVNQAQVKPGASYNLHTSSLRAQLSSYISEELDYQERLQHLSNRPSGSSGDNLLEGFKLKFEASVSQLAYLIKVFIGTKVIVNNNMTHILQFLVRFVITKRSETISYASFRSKFYNVETGTKKSVRTMLLSMVQYIDKD
jgi:hypothetical protein